jgi:membrane protein YqaA with SNARE-associated domain
VIAGEALAAAGFGLASALVPVLNAEAYLAVSGVAAPATAVLVACALALGQTLGKVALYEAARHGGARAVGHRGARHRRPRFGVGLASRLTELLRRPWLGGVTVFVSASVGVPPLAVVSVLAGGAGVHRLVFVVGCLLGRTGRFLAIALPLVAAGS